MYFFHSVPKGQNHLILTLFGVKTGVKQGKTWDFQGYEIHLFRVGKKKPRHLPGRNFSII